MDNKLIEKLAEYIHNEQWSGWTEYMLRKLFEESNDCACGKCNYCLDNKDLFTQQSYIDRWKRQINTEYKDLSEEEKESDRIEARRIMELIKVEKHKAITLPKKEKEKFTCYDCKNNDICKYAWDLYNTNGDCLASK